jgi:integrase
MAASPVKFALVNSGSSREELERMAKRRFQEPKPFREGNYWWITPWVDEFTDGHITRRKKRIKVADLAISEREARRIAAELMRPMNQGMETIGSATPFGTYVDATYRPTILPLLAAPVRKNYEYMLNRHLLPVFMDSPLRTMTTLTLQKFFSGLKVSYASASKIRDALASVLNSAVEFEMLMKNPLKSVRLVRPRTGKRIKPTITPQQFQQLIDLVAEPYATMIYVCVLSGLRVSELIGLKWEDVHSDSLTIDERFCRGDWSVPKSEFSNATIGIDPSVTERIRKLKDLEVTIKWGARGHKTFKVVRSSGPTDLVFQSLRTGAPMSDQNILKRHIQPVAEKLGIGCVTWQVLRRSYGTWMAQAGANPKDVQGQMRHSRISTTMDIYAQFVPESQRVAVKKMMTLVSANKNRANRPSSGAVN